MPTDFSKYDFSVKEAFYKAVEKEVELDRPTQVAVLGGDFNTRYDFSYKAENVIVGDVITLNCKKETNGFSGAFITLNNKPFTKGRVDVVADVPVIKGVGVTFKLTSDTNEEYSTSLEFLSINGKSRTSTSRFHAYFIDKCDKKQKHIAYLAKTAQADLTQGENTFSLIRNNEYIALLLNGNVYKKVDLQHPLTNFFTQTAYLEIDITAGSYLCDEIDISSFTDVSLKIKSIEFTETEE